MSTPMSVTWRPQVQQTAATEEARVAFTRWGMSVLHGVYMQKVVIVNYNYNHSLWEGQPG